MLWLLLTPLLAGSAGDLTLSLGGGYQGEADPQQRAHRAQLGLGLDAAFNNRGRLLLRTRYSQLLYQESLDARVAPVAMSHNGLDLSAGAVVLIDRLPGVEPLLLVELSGGYHPLAAAPARTGWAPQLRAGAAVGVGADVLLGGGWILGVVARYSLNNTMEGWMQSVQPASGLALEVSVGYRLQVGRTVDEKKL
ncbi:MAG: hypothetical protein ABIJ09_14025 [Pseudomonadota bacterium]